MGVPRGAHARRERDDRAAFEHEADGRRFLDMMRERTAEFALTLHPEKTRLITFGRLAAAQRAKPGLGKPETVSGSDTIYDPTTLVEWLISPGVVL
jgi:hypothetical protein